MKKLIINLVPTGMIPTKEMNPHLPISVQEIIDDVLECAKLGVSIVHLHARETNGIPTYKKDIYAEIIAGIRKRNPELILCVSTSGRNYPDFGKRSEVLNLDGELKPDMASLTLSSLNFSQTASVNSPDTIMNLAKMMKEKGIKPELEVFDLGMVNYAKYLISKGLIDPPFYFNIILGNIASAQAALLHAGLIISELPPESYVALSGIGNSQTAMNGLGVIAADGIRVGLEDNIWYDQNRKIWATNRALVERVVLMAHLFDCSIAHPQDVRRMLQLTEMENGSGKESGESQYD